jgi:hypothetical protein
MNDRGLSNSSTNNEPLMGDGPAWQSVAASIDNGDWMTSLVVNPTEQSQDMELKNGSSNSMTGGFSIFGVGATASLEYSTGNDEITEATFDAAHPETDPHWFWGDDGPPTNADVFYSGPATPSENPPRPT